MTDKLSCLLDTSAIQPKHWGYAKVVFFFGAVINEWKISRNAKAIAFDGGQAIHSNVAGAMERPRKMAKHKTHQSRQRSTEDANVPAAYANNSCRGNGFVLAITICTSACDD